MKIIAIVKEGDTFLAEVTKTELDKLYGRYYNSKANPLVLKIGSVMDLGEGYDYSSDIKSAFSKTQALIESNQPVINAIMNGLRVVSLNPDPVRSPAEQACVDYYNNMAYPGKDASPCHIALWEIGYQIANGAGGGK